MDDVFTRLRKRADGAPTPEENEAQRKESEAKQAERETLIRVGDLARKLGRRYHPDLTSLDSFQVYHKSQEEVLNRLRSIVPSVAEFVKAGRGIIFYGSVGTGKDFLLAAMLYAAVRAGVRVEWVNGLEIFRVFRDAMDDRHGESEREIMDRFRQPALLGLSDPLPPVGETSAWRTETLYRILDARYRDGQPIWATMNVVSPDEADKKLSSPVFDRLRHGAELVKCFWPSFRERP
jgi:DNA replication protein DnaC